MSETSLNRVSTAEDGAVVTSSLRESLDRWRQELLTQRLDAATAPSQHWEGQLSPSALSTATAVSALATVLLQGSHLNASERQRYAERIDQGIAYLRGSQNEDGGFGDTDRSRSNIATTLLVLAAERLARRVAETTDQAGFSTSQRIAAEAYTEREGSWDGLRRRYGKDKTFVVPILSNCAIAGMVDWQQVSPLPFEAAVFPQSMYRFLRMPVVSYAIPALVAIGQARFLLGSPPLAPLRWIRRAALNRTTRVLRQMQPESGGYLEATPLTSFVLMSLAATGRSGEPVAQDCLRFLVDSVLEDGSWPIDTNLATFVTSLAAHALATDPADDGRWRTAPLMRWHLHCQHRRRHPFTGAEPGGWGWTDLSGAVPDGDDTPGAMLALVTYRRGAGSGEADRRAAIDQALADGCDWLLQLQNRDGGWPTFCRGWGRLPFDRSSVDLTAHALRALQAYGDALGEQIAPRRRAAMARALQRGWRFVTKTQRTDGSWLPLWFGNQDRPDDENPFYGTGRVLVALGEAGVTDSPGVREACGFLLARQNPDGGWGGGPTLADWLAREGLPAVDRETGVAITSSIEETAVVLEGLAAVGGERHLRASILAGIRFLDQAHREGRHRTPWPIGFYFAKLWYHERLYPAVFATAALARVLKSWGAGDTEGPQEVRPGARGRPDL